MLMKEVADHPQWSQDLGEIIRQTIRCKEIVTRILEFSRPSMGQRFSFNANEAIDRCVELLRNQALFINTRESFWSWGPIFRTFSATQARSSKFLPISSSTPHMP
jgi:hypothetical protein